MPHLEVMTLLLDAGANINATEDDGDTALIIAAYFNNLDACKLLVARGADKTIQGKDGKTAKFYAEKWEKKGKAALAELLG